MGSAPVQSRERALVRRQALRVLAETKTMAAPVPVSRVAHRLGLRVGYELSELVEGEHRSLGKTVPSDAAWLGILEDLHGLYVPGVHPQVHVRPGLSRARRRFVIAHEIGHHVYNHDVVRRHPDGFGGESNRLELVADSFAVELLCVGSEFTDRLEQSADPRSPIALDEVLTLASRFGITVFTALRRLTETGTRDYLLVTVRLGRHPGTLRTIVHSSARWRDKFGEPSVVVNESTEFGRTSLNLLSRHEAHEADETALSTQSARLLGPLPVASQTLVTQRSIHCLIQSVAR